MSERIQKIDDLIRDHLSELFVSHLSLKSGVFLTIQKVRTSKDLRHSKIYVSAFPEAESSYGIQTLKHEQRNLEKTLHERLYMKPLPKLRFILDETEKEADVVEKILLDPNF